MKIEPFVIHADLRDESGKGASRRLRHEGKVPAILYGDSKKSQSLTLNHDEVIQHLEQEAFYSQVLTLVANGKKQRAILRDIQRHPWKPKVMHMDFQRINSRKKLNVSIPLHFINEETSVGFKAGGIVSHQINELEVSCLPGDLPEYIEVDVEALDLGDNIFISDLKLPEGVESVILSHGDDYDQPVVSIVHRAAPQTVEDDEADEVAADEVPTASDDSAEETTED
ncbi:MAG: 50S ribosomal protein L25/general stress protein Ctc [Gammaproteobacteria bacterium]|nr:50S ribosomal protein L25/general stress protein Ctc [Gammaproteobacteria bacterium]NNJ72254.1 50S ribosomal protein L25/general stress protein Ctc [Enterobacterales bacterium]